METKTKVIAVGTPDRQLSGNSSYCVVKMRGRADQGGSLDLTQPDRIDIEQVYPLEKWKELTGTELPLALNGGQPQSLTLWDYSGTITQYPYLSKGVGFPPIQSSGGDILANVDSFYPTWDKVIIDQPDSMSVYFYTVALRLDLQDTFMQIDSINSLAWDMWSSSSIMGIYSGAHIDSLNQLALIKSDGTEVNTHGLVSMDIDESNTNLWDYKPVYSEGLAEEPVPTNELIVVGLDDGNNTALTSIEITGQVIEKAAEFDEIAFKTELLATVKGIGEKIDISNTHLDELKKKIGTSTQ